MHLVWRLDESGKAGKLLGGQLVLADQLQAGQLLLSSQLASPGLFTSILQLCLGLRLYSAEAGEGGDLLHLPSMRLPLTVQTRGPVDHGGSLRRSTVWTHLSAQHLCMLGLGAVQLITQPVQVLLESMGFLLTGPFSHFSPAAGNFSPGSARFRLAGVTKQHRLVDADILMLGSGRNVKHTSC